MSVTKTYACIADAKIYSGFGGTGSGKDNSLDVGLISGGIYRSLAKFALPNWTAEQVKRITSAKIRFFNSVFAGRGASPRALTKRCVANWSEGSGASLGSNGGGVTWNNQPFGTAVGQADTTLPTADNAIVDIDATGFVRLWAPTSVEGGGGLPNYGVIIHSFDEASTTRTTEFWSRESAKDPVLIITWDIGTAPSAPVDLVPASAADGSASVLPIAAPPYVPGMFNQRVKNGTFAGTAVDPDPGDYITGVEIAIHADSANDSTPGTPILDYILTDFTGTPTTYSRAVDLSGLTIGTNYRHRVRTRDQELNWGAWSTLTAGRFTPNTVPDAPTNLAVDPSSQTPNFFGTLRDADPGATISNVAIEVYQDTVQGAVLKWASGWVASGGTRFQMAYGSSAILEFGVQYRWRAAIQDQYGTAGPYSAWQFWTPQEAFGANNMVPRTVETKINTVTPNLAIGHSAMFDAYAVQVARYADGSELLWDKPLTVIAPINPGSFANIGYFGASLDWGKTYYWRTKIRVGGVTISDWGPWFPFYINALPRAPIVTIDGASQSPSDYVAVTTTTPTIRSPFSDPDLDKGYTEAETNKYILIFDRTLNAYVAAYSGGGASGWPAPIGDTHVVSPALTMEHHYAVAVLVRDNAAQLGPWSPWFYFKCSAAPTTALAVAIDVNDPSPTIDWTFTSTPGKAQLGFQVQVFENVSGKVVHDTGTAYYISPDTQYVVPGGILQNATAYRATVYASDTDGLTAVLAIAPWTTSFSTPAALTGLVATPDLDASAIALAWDVTALSDAQFWRYRIYRRNLDTGASDLIGEVASKATPTWIDKEAPHGVTVNYAVTVSNGWAESEPITIQTTMALEWWIVSPTNPSLTFSFPYFESFRDQEAQEQEVFTPLGRHFPLVVSGEQLAPAGTVMWKILPGDPDGLRSKFRQAAKVSPWVVLKSPSGDVLRVKLGSIDRDLDFYGVQVVSVDFQAVA